MTKQKLYIALGIYAVMALITFAVLTGPIRLAMWVFLGGLAVKTFIASVPRD